MKARIQNPAVIVPGALEALRKLAASATSAGIPETTIYMTQLRASQINGCSGCVDIHTRELELAGAGGPRVNLVAAWRDSPYFTDPERAALALTEAVTRLADRPDAVSDEVWDEAARHYSEPQLAALLISIATINAFNRLNVATHQMTGEFVTEFIRAPSPAAA